MKISPFEFKLPDSQFILKCEEEIEISSTGCYLVSGASGEGKSTFLKLLKGFYPEFISGNVTGEMATFPNSHYLFQNPFTQLIHDDALSEFMFSMENKKFTKIEMDQNKLWLSHFGLQLNDKSKTHSLSHGEVQRLLLASLVAANPEWLFLDEPTAFLDIKLRAELYKLFGELKKKIGLLIIDHHTEEISPIVDGYFYIEKQGDVSYVKYSSVKLESIKISRENLSFDKLPIQNINLQIKVQDLNFSYAEKDILKNFTAEFKTGEVTSIVGPSGVGKSTLLKILIGILKEKSGQVSIQNRLKVCSFLFQNPETHFLLDTVQDELDSFDFDENLKTDLIVSFGLKKCLDVNPFLLSEGEKRRLSLLMVMMMNRPFLLLDEPTFGQDQVQVELIKKFILEYKKKNYGVILISHDPDFYEAITDRVIHLKGANES